MSQSLYAMITIQMVVEKQEDKQGQQRTYNQAKRHTTELYQRHYPIEIMTHS